jgi:predicted nucleic acid-binding protein
VLIYLDNCCFNRPYDSQLVEQVKLETEAKLLIQQRVLTQKIQLAWSFMLDFENDANPYSERKESIAEWKTLATVHISALETVKIKANQLVTTIGIQPKDALHLACSIEARCHYFITTDKRLLKKAPSFTIIHIVNPIDFVPILKVIL